MLNQYDHPKNTGVSLPRSYGVTLLRRSGVSFIRSSGVSFSGISSYTSILGSYYGLILDNQENALDTVPLQYPFAHRYSDDQYALLEADGIYIYNRADKSSYKLVSNYSDQFVSSSTWCWLGSDLIWGNWCGVNRITPTGSNTVLKPTTFSDRYRNISYLPNINKLIAIRVKNWDDQNIIDVLHTRSKIIMMNVDGSNEIELSIP